MDQTYVFRASNLFCSLRTFPQSRSTYMCIVSRLRAEVSVYLRPSKNKQPPRQCKRRPQGAAATIRYPDPAGPRPNKTNTLRIIHTARPIVVGNSIRGRRRVLGDNHTPAMHFGRSIVQRDKTNQCTVIVLLQYGVDVGKNTYFCICACVCNGIQRILTVSKIW